MGDLLFRLDRNCRNLALVGQVALRGDSQDARKNAQAAALIYMMTVNMICADMGEELYSVEKGAVVL